MFARSPKRSITIEYDPANPRHESPTSGATLCGRYRLETAVARGASAVVYRATDLILGETVAIKVLLPDGVFATPEARGAQLGFREEAVSAMRLGHPAILRVFNYEREGECEFIVMEYVAGETLSQLSKRRPEKHLSTLETIEVGLECLEGLAYAHAMGVIHNDIKPSNLLMSRAGAIKICDFGLARIMRPSSAARGIIAGTPGYMPPEILKGHAGDERSDLFSLAATLYAIGNGLLMVPKDPVKASQWTRPPHSPHLPLIVDEVLAVAAAADPRDRFQSAADMRNALLYARSQVTDHHSRFAVQPLAVDVDVGGAWSDAPDADVPDADAPGSAAPGSAAPGSAAPAPPPPAPPAFFEGDVTEPGAGRPYGLDDDAAMVRIAARRVQSAYGGSVYVDELMLDRTPVTNLAYATFVQATGAAPPAHWLAGEPPAHQLDHPVVGVTLDDARAYAAWCGKRLPTSAEWEAAARGPTVTTFPWGDAWEPARCTTRDSGAEGTASVEEHPEGATIEGVLDLVGNVWEWCEPDPRLQPPESGSAWVYGGSFRHACVKDGAIARSAVATGNSYQYLGFRCARGGAR
jgi:serine/threonine protein kinase